MKSTLAAISVLSATMLPAHEATALEADWSFSGFATLGIVSTRAEHARFLRVGINAPDKRNPNAGIDSVLGLQANVRLGAHNAAVLQVLARETPRGDHPPRIRLAFVSHQLTPELTARVGRMRIPFFMLSDSIDINYSHPWVRPPVELYGLNPFSDLDGVDLLYRSRLGGLDVEVHPYLGRSSISVLGGGRARLREMGGVNLTLARGDLSISLGHAAARLGLQRRSAALQTLLDLPPAVPPELRARLSGNDTHASFSSIGFQWDDGAWLMIGEVARTKANRYNNSAHAWSLTAGRRLGSVTPYVTVSRSRQDEPIFHSDIAARDPRLTFLNRSRNQAQESVSAGMRWDFSRSAALKFEYTRIHTDREAWGSFAPTRNAFTTRMGDRRVNLLSLSVDVVF